MRQNAAESRSGRRSLLAGDMPLLRTRKGIMVAAWRDVRSAVVSRAGLVTTAAMLACCSTAIAQRTGPKPPPATYATAFDGWAARSGVQHGMIVANRDERTLMQTSIGAANPASPVLLASLSKAITAACIAVLIKERRLAWSTPIKDALADTLKAHGAPVDPRVLTITIEQLVLHRAGFSTRPRDALSTLTLRSFLEKNTARATQFGPLLAATLRHPLSFQPGERYAYSNAGYLALGAVIEEVTKEPYEGACRSRVLSPLGVGHAELDRSWAVLSSYAGWSMSGAEYLKFFSIFAPENPLLGRDMRIWLADRRGKIMSGEHWYGLGVRIDPSAGGKLMISHTGAWPWTQPTAKDGPLLSSTGTYAVRYPDGTSLFAAFWPLSHDEIKRDLAYNELVSVLRQVNAKPAPVDGRP